jgi:hypothetical protein
VQREGQRPADRAHEVGGADGLDGLDRGLGREQRDVAAVAGEPAHGRAHVGDRPDPREDRRAEGGQRPAGERRRGREQVRGDQREGHEPREAGAEQVGDAREADPVLRHEAVGDPGAEHRDRRGEPAREREQRIARHRERDRAEGEAAERGEQGERGLVVAQLHGHTARTAQQARPHVADRRVLQREEAGEGEVDDREARVPLHGQGQHRDQLDDRRGRDLTGDHPEIGGVLHGILTDGAVGEPVMRAPPATIREAESGRAIPRSTAERR